MSTFRPSPSHILAGALFLAGSTVAEAAEIDFEGFYRSRARAYDSLSLDRDLADYEGLSAWVEHRFWLRPRVLISDEISVFAEIRGLDNVVWGNRPVTWFDPVADGLVPQAFTEELSAPIPDTDPAATLRDITLWRAWGEVRSGDHLFRFGRVPLHWGLGVWQNDGLGLHGLHGDSADRVQWEGLFGDIWASLAVDVMASGFVNERDGTVAFNALTAWRTEQVVAGLNLQLRHTLAPPGEAGRLNVFTVSGAVDAQLGFLEIRGEAVGRFGGGDLDTGLTDITIATGGGVLDLTARTDIADLGLIAGVASGDADPTDSRIKTFTFDRDFRVGFILWEHPLPTLAAAIPGPENAGRSFEQALTGPAISNAIFFVPKVGRDLPLGLRGEVQAVVARSARLPDLPQFENRAFYGVEGNATLRYVDMDHLDVAATAGLFVPGPHFTNADIGGYVLGGQLTARIRF